MTGRPRPPRIADCPPNTAGVTSGKRLYAQLPMWREIVCNTYKGAGEWSAALPKLSFVLAEETL
jgi:hypothetical protein